MTSYAHLGPPPPAEADDLPPLRVLDFEVMGVLTGLGEAMVRMTVQRRETGAGNVRLSILVNPRTCDVVRVSARSVPGGAPMPLSPADLPGMVLDLARSATQRAFPPLV